MLLRDPDIRAPFEAWLWDAHAPPGDTVIVHELKIPRPSARVDIAVVNGELCGFEIKSDVDGLSRLPRQVRAFNAVFDRVSVVTTERHAKSAQRLIPDWWGILAPEENEVFHQLQQSKLNPAQDHVAALHLLTRNELVDVLTAHGMSVGFKAKRRPVLIGAVMEMLMPNELLFAIRHMLKQRYRGYSPSLSSA